MSKKRLRAMTPALIAAWLLAGSAMAALPPLLPIRPFTVGERLAYRIRLGPVTVGTATLEIVALRTCGDRTAYEMRYTARSNGILAAIYPVRDRVTTWADTLDFRSHRLQKRIREGSFRESRDLRLDHGAGRAWSPDGASLAIPEFCHDVFSALLRLRSSELVPGRRLEVPVLLGGAVSSLAIDVGGSREVSVPAGAFPCLAVTPHLGQQGPFRHEGPVTVDLSRQGRRLPVRVTLRVPVVGDLRVELVEINTTGRFHKKLDSSGRQ